MVNNPALTWKKSETNIQRYKETVLGHFEHYKKYCESYSIIQNFPKAQKWSRACSFDPQKWGHEIHEAIILI